jgi:hypothetical protein
VWFYTQNVISTYTSVILTRVRVNMTLTTVIYIRKSAISHAECDFYMHKSDFYTQSAISIRRVWFPHTWVWFYTQSVMSTHMSVILHAECDFHTHKCNVDTCACEYDTNECKLYTKSAILHAVWFLHAKSNFHTQSVISTLTRGISTRKVPHTRV